MNRNFTRFGNRFTRFDLDIHIEMSQIRGMAEPNRKKKRKPKFKALEREHIQDCPIEKLSLYPYNFRNHSVTMEALEDAFTEIGYVDTINVVPKGDGYMIISGEGRYRTAMQMGVESIDVMLIKGLKGRRLQEYVEGANRIGRLTTDDPKRKAKQLRRLIEHSKAHLKSMGFMSKAKAESALNRAAKRAQKVIKGAVEFATELLESNHYVLLVFRNDRDWLHALSHFRLKRQKSKHSTPGHENIGQGKVLDGVETLRNLGVGTDERESDQSGEP